MIVNFAFDKNREHIKIFGYTLTPNLLLTVRNLYIASSAYPDQTAPSSLVWVLTV